MNAPGRHPVASPNAPAASGEAMPSSRRMATAGEVRSRIAAISRSPMFRPCPAIG